MEKALLHYTTASEHVHRLLLCLIIHASKDEDHARAMKTLNDTFKGKQHPSIASLLHDVLFILSRLRCGSRTSWFGLHSVHDGSLTLSNIFFLPAVA